LTRIAPTRVELEIPITGEELAAAEERAFRKLVKRARLPGFRPGRVPRKVFEQAYGAEAITSQAMDEVLPEAYAKAVREHDLQPVERPTMEVLEESDGRPTRLKATVEVRPEIELGEYKGIEITRPPLRITDEDVDRSLSALARERATLAPVDRPAQLADVLTVDYEGRVDGEAFEGGTAQGQEMELAEERFIPGFVAGIVGMKAGETREIDVTFPDPYAEPSLAGKAARFTIAVHEVKQLELPEINDEFAQAVSSSQSVAELQADIRKRLEAIAQSRERRAIGNAVMEKLLVAQEFPLPETLVDAEIDNLVNDVASTATRAGTTFEAYLEQIGKTADELRAQYRPEAESRVKATLIVEQIARTEKIVATPADVQEELEALARQYGQPVARIRKALGNNVLSLMDGIIRNKTLDFLIDNAEVTTEETSGSPS
jgi:trigger factor